MTAWFKLERIRPKFPENEFVIMDGNRQVRILLSVYNETGKVKIMALNEGEKEQ